MKTVQLPRWFAALPAACIAAVLSSCGTVPLTSWPDGVNLLVDGSFEDGTGPNGSFKPNAQGVMSLQSGSTSLPGWTLVDNARFGQDIAWLQNTNWYVPNGATDGTHFLDLTGLSDKTPNGQFGVIRQSFATIPRTRYWASVDIGVKNPEYPGPIQVRMAMSATNSNPAEYAQVTCPYNPSALGIQWTTCSMEFTANSDSTLISIYGVQGTQYIGIDNVTVQCIAPLGRHAWCGGAPPL